MTDRLAARQLAEELVRGFVQNGATRLDPPILLDAESLLDLYGEDIRARAYVSADPMHGERILRPDFTVPVVQAHLASDQPQPVRYAYAGEVFRKQEDDPERAPEYLQVGIEQLGMENPSASEAEIFATIHKAVAALGLRFAIGDMSLLRHAVEGLETTPRRRAALMRHIWRPKRFRDLLERFSKDRSAAYKARDAAAVPEIVPGRRRAEEIRARLAWLQDDSQQTPFSPEVLTLFDLLLSLRETAPNALQRLDDLAVDVPSITPSVEQMEQRLEALTQHGIDVHQLEFEASYGRTTLEYYDGFVFGGYAPRRPDLPPVVSGGRFDALVRALGAKTPIAAFGAVLRPELMLTLQQEAQQ